VEDKKRIIDQVIKTNDPVQVANETQIPLKSIQRWMKLGPIRKQGMRICKFDYWRGRQKGQGPSNGAKAQAMNQDHLLWKREKTYPKAGSGDGSHLFEQSILLQGLEGLAGEVHKEAEMLELCYRPEWLHLARQGRRISIGFSCSSCALMQSQIRNFNWRFLQLNNC